MSKQFIHHGRPLRLAFGPSPIAMFIIGSVGLGLLVAEGMVLLVVSGLGLVL